MNSKIIVTKLDVKAITEIKKTWEKFFVPAGIDKEKIHFNSFLWHIFSFKVRECEEGEQAIQRFMEIPKSSIYVFFQHDDTGYLIENAKVFGLDSLQQFITDFKSKDIYTVDKDFNWTFAKTHEEGWLGPFLQNNLIVAKPNQVFREEFR